MKFVSAVFLFILSGTFSFGQIPAGYYNGTNGKSGDELKEQLNDIIADHEELSYKKCWTALSILDQDPNNSENIIGFYSRFSIPSAPDSNNRRKWDREHIWAKSRGDFGTRMGAGTDLHHLRAADKSTNSARNNRSFDVCEKPYIDQGGDYKGPTDAKKGDDWTWEPPDNLKGDVARMMFYMVVRYEGENNEPDLELTNDLPDKYDKSPFHGKLSTLLIWHSADPVSTDEKTRNNLIYQNYQNNRNPFIDRPEFVSLIWEFEQNTPELEDTDELDPSNVLLKSVYQILEYFYLRFP